MLRYQLTHPTILSALASAGHGSRVLISDGHYPHTTGANPAAERVYLNLTPDRLLVTEVLDALVTAIPIESATVMTPPPRPPPPRNTPEPEIFPAFRAALPHLPHLDTLDRPSFYAAARLPDTALVIATADRRTYANLLLTLGVRPD
jgi:L-fucose mutarotase